MEKFSIFFLLGAMVLLFWFGYLVPMVLNRKPDSAPDEQEPRSNRDF